MMIRPPDRETGISNMQKPQTVQRQAQTLSSQNLALSPNVRRGKEMTQRLEGGFSSTPYMDSLGNPTIGFGFNMNAHPNLPKQITYAAAQDYFDKQYQIAQGIAQDFAGEDYDQLNADRQLILNDMAYNMGNKLKTFQNMKEAIKARDWNRAAAEMENSKWYHQTKSRAKELVQLWKNAFDPEADGYDYMLARNAKLGPDRTGHWPSLDPRTGMVLKGRNHPTWDLMLQEEERLGNEIVFKNGRYFSQPIDFVVDTDENGNVKTFDGIKLGKYVENQNNGDGWYG